MGRGREDLLGGGGTDEMNKGQLKPGYDSRFDNHVIHKKQQNALEAKGLKLF